VNPRHIVLAVLAAAFTLTSVAAAGTDATKQRIAINAKVRPEGTFVLVPLRPGSLKRDSGTFNAAGGSGRTVTRNGQEVLIYTNAWTLGGKRGSVTLREQIEWVSIGRDGNRDGQDDTVATGTWKVVGGTGAYARIAGGGGSGHAGLEVGWIARFEGFLTVP
jgi:hypothetical protein